ncbi:hypothetical protein MPTK1_2g06530 [Marchantia polymorpha subsp. ruderalis]
MHVVFFTGIRLSFSSLIEENDGFVKGGDSMERGEEETRRDEQEEIGSERAAQDWEEFVSENPPPPSPPPTFEQWRENWEPKLREASRERNVEVLRSILYDDCPLHDAVEHGETDFVRELTQCRFFDPVGEDADLSIFIFKLVIEIFAARSESYSRVSIFRILKLEPLPRLVRFSNLTKYFDKIDKTNILKYIVPVEDGYKDSPSFEKLSHALIKRLKALVMNVESPIYLRTPLHVAVLSGHQDIAEYLLDKQEKLDECVSLFETNFHRDAYGLTPLHYAVLIESKSFVKLFVESHSYSAFVNVGEFSQRTPLHLACSRRDLQRDTHATDVVAILVGNSSVDLNAKDCCGYTPLHWAVHVGALGAVNLLLERKIKLDEKDVDGNNALHHVHAAARSTAGDVQRRDLMLELESVVTSDPRVEKRIDRMYRDRQVYVDAANAILVGAAVIASVTYGGWLQPPLGDHDEHTRRIARLFWGFNSLSFSFAIATVMAGAGAVLPAGDLYIEDAVARVRDWLAVTAFLLLVSAAFVLGAFGAAGFASMTTVGDLEANMTVTTIVGGAVWLLIASVFLRGLSRVSSVWPSKRLLTGCARLFSSPSAPLRTQRGISIVLYEQLRLSKQPVNFSVVNLQVLATESRTHRDIKTIHQWIQFPTTFSCRQFCMERDSLFPFRCSEPSWKFES